MRAHTVDPSSFAIGWEPLWLTEKDPGIMFRTSQVVGGAERRAFWGTCHCLYRGSDL